MTGQVNDERLRQLAGMQNIEMAAMAVELIEARADKVKSEKLQKLHEALGRVKVTYLGYSGVRTLLGKGDDPLRIAAKNACQAATNLECELLKAIKTLRGTADG